MAGVTDAPMRLMCARHGAPLCVSEMITARAVVERHAATLRMITPHPDESHHSVQLYGTDPHYLGEAVRFVAGEGLADHIDLNFGCPVAKVTRLGGGAALPYKRRLFSAMVEAAVSAAGTVPVTVKFRMGVDDDHLTHLDSARAAEAAGARWVALHARTALDGYGPPARWDAIADLVAAVDIPVLGNGDIWEASDAVAMMRQTGCAGVVIGRGCLGKPYLFAQLRDALSGGVPADPPKLGELTRVIVEHAQLVQEWRGAHGMRSFRKHLGWYLKGYPVGGTVRRAIGNIETVDDVAALCDGLDPTAELPETNRRLVRSHSAAQRTVALPPGWLSDPFDELRPAPGAESLVSGG